MAGEVGKIDELLDMLRCKETKDCSFHSVAPGYIQPARLIYD